MKPKFTFLLLPFLAFAFHFNYLHAQNIYTFAGNPRGAAGYSGDGGNATLSMLNQPSCVATHDYSNVFIADQGNHVVRLVNYLDNITTFAGKGVAGYTGDGGPADSCELYSPYSIALDWSGNLYIADFYNNVVRKVNASGVITTIAGNDTAGYRGDGGPATNAELMFPYGLAIDASGNIYIADAGNNVIRVVTSSGLIQTIVGNGYGAGLGLGHGGYSGDGGPALSAELNFPYAITVDAARNIFIADAGNHVIRKVGLSDSISTFAGTGYEGYSGDGGYASLARLNFPSAVAVDGYDNLYIADQGNDVVRKVDSAGVIHTIAGTGASGYTGDGHAATAAQLNTPKGVAIDGSGLIYISDAGNNVVRVVGTYNVNGVPQVSGTGGIRVFPNPGNGSFTVEIPAGVTGGIMTVTDMLGRNVTTRTLDGAPSVTLNDCAPGNYVIRITSGDLVYREKVVVISQ